MFSSPMVHYFRHVLTAYKENGKSINERIEVSHKLNHVEDALIKLLNRNPGNAKVQALIEKVRKIKAGL